MRDRSTVSLEPRLTPDIARANYAVEVLQVPGHAAVRMGLQLKRSWLVSTRDHAAVR
jgi:hypothetical protein